MSEVWDAVATRDFRDWRGLPRDARYADFDARFPRLTDAEARGLLGSANEITYYRVHVAEGYPQHLKAWRQDTRLVLIEATLPVLATPLPELTAALGEPAALLDFRWDVLDVPEGVHVHPDRGIALFVGPEGQLLRLSLFAPCDLAEYMATRRTTDRLVERP